MAWEQHNRFVAQQQLRKLKQRQPDQFTSYGIPGTGAANPNPNLQMQIAGGGGYRPKVGAGMGGAGFNPGALRPNPPPPFQFYGDNAGILNIEKMGIEEAQRLAAEAQQQGLGMAGGFLNDPLVGGLQTAGMGLLEEPTSRANPIFANLTGGIRRNQLLRGQEAGANLANRFGFDWAGDRGAIGNELATETANELGTLAQNVALQEANRMDQLRLQNLGAASGIAGQQQGWRKDLADSLFGLEFQSPDYTPLIQPGPSGIPGYAGGGGSTGGRRRLGRPGTRKVGNVGWWKGSRRAIA